MSVIAKAPQIPPPLPDLSFWPKTRLWLSSFFIDHAFFRFWLNTRKRVGPEAYRSSHPLDYQLVAAQREGIGSVINLRGSNDTIASSVLERAVCERIGLPLAHYPLLSREVPSREDIFGFAKLLEDLPKPVLMHCKSGADRAGLGSALYLLLRENASPERAMEELRFWPYGHIRQAKTGILDHFLAAYQSHHAAHGTRFLDWVEHHYNPQTVARSFHYKSWAEKLVASLLRRE